MGAGRFCVAISLTAGLVAIVACQEPTQVTIDVRLATATCVEIHGTAINVGVRPTDTEEKVRSKFPNAQTTDCDGATSRIGTLVVTPSDEDRGSVIVVTSYGTKTDPTECQPPHYTDCIVARRQFTFTKHRRLELPITIDPTCVNVPCDAFSTCRKGSCFASDAEPCEPGEDCLEPGETANGGTDKDAAVDPDTGTPVTKPTASCDGTILRCGDAPCGAGLRCCNTAAGAICQPECGVQLCCSAGDCGGRTCMTGSVPPRGIPDAQSDFDSQNPPIDAPPDIVQPPIDAPAFPDAPIVGDSSTAFDSGNDSGQPPADSGSSGGDSGSDSGSTPPGLGICN